MFVHLTLVPYVGHAGELKTKPTQHSVNELRRIGIQPHALVCRSEGGLDRDIRRKIALFASLPEDGVISAATSTTRTRCRSSSGPRESTTRCSTTSGSTPRRPTCPSGSSCRRADAATRKVRIALVGKHVQLADAYKSVVEALRHGGYHHGADVEVALVNSEDPDPDDLEAADGILIPGGFGERGIEGKVLAARIAREKGIPFLGICLGMQMAVVEFARHAAGFDGANSSEFDPRPRIR